MKARSKKRVQSASEEDVLEWLDGPRLEVWSGGQIGADIAGLRAAKYFKLKTGGYIPKGFLTLRGNRPEYREQYGLVPTSAASYPMRTELNVKHTDMTVRLATDFESRGELLTKRCAERFEKPYYDVWVYGENWIDQQIELFHFIEENKFKRINIAGNACPAIEVWVEWFLRPVFANLLEVGFYDSRTPNRLWDVVPTGQYEGMKFEDVPVRVLREWVNEPFDDSGIGWIGTAHQTLIVMGEMK